MISPAKMEFWIKNNYNVLFSGKHGIGKSSLIIDAFNAAGLKWKYFSAATMDPWVDFIGVPKEKEDPNGNYLELVRPLEFQRDEIEALFFDEFSRSHKKVRNAVMELIQFKSINGKKFNNLKIIWAAINPEDDDAKYDVETLDPAQADRFHIKVNLPYSTYLPYFRQKYGEMGQAAVAWWKSLPESVQADVSPRRLDYALDVYRNKGDMRDVLPREANISKLITEITYGSIAKKLKTLYSKRKKEEAKQFLISENNYSACIDDIIKNSLYMGFFLPLIENERLIALMSKKRKVSDFMLDNHESFKELLSSVVDANQNKTLARQISKKLNISNTVIPFRSTHNCSVNPKHKKFVSKTRGGAPYSSVLKGYKFNSVCNTTTGREAMYQEIREHMPLNITKDDALKTLEFISNIISRSHRSSLLPSKSRFKDLLPIINHCFKTIYDSGITDLRDIKDKYVTVGRAIDFGMNYPQGFFYEFNLK